MIKHLFKLIWNRKRKNFLMILEIFLSFIVLFAVSSMAIYGINNYMKPLGFEYEDVWVLGFNSKGVDEGRVDIIRQIKQEIASYNEIKNIALLSSNYPYSNSTWRSDIKYNGNEYMAHLFRADDNFANVLGINVIEGRWFNGEDDVSKLDPIIISEEMKEQVFADEPAVGKIFEEERRSGTKNYEVVGVVENYRYKGEVSDIFPAFFTRTSLKDSTLEIYHFIFGVTSGTDIQFEEQLLKKLSMITNDWSFSINRLENLRKSYLKDHFIPFIIYFVIAGFLILNVALGIFGILWHSINRRYREIGLRCAVGASSKDIIMQIIGETLVLTSFALLAGTFIAIQIPILGIFGDVDIIVYIISMLSSSIAILAIVALCSFYPSKLASEIQPAVALHYE